MKVFFILIIFSFMLVTCQEKCIVSFYPPEFKDGKQVEHDICPDLNGRDHLIGSTWDDDNGFHCECRRDGSYCCKRYGDFLHRPGCIAMDNPETCGYDFYKVDAPLQRC